MGLYSKVPRDYTELNEKIEFLREVKKKQLKDANVTNDDSPFQSGNNSPGIYFVKYVYINRHHIFRLCVSEHRRTSWGYDHSDPINR